MEEYPIMIPLSQEEFWTRMREVVEKALESQLEIPFEKNPVAGLPTKALLKSSEVCQIFQISKTTLYEWMRQEKLISFKIKSRRYFARKDIEDMIRKQ